MRKITVLLLVLMSVSVIYLFIEDRMMRERVRELETRLISIVDRQAENDEFIKKRLVYVYKFVKDKTVAYRILKEVKKYSDTFRVDADLVLAVIEHESNFDSSAVSPKGAIGLMQLMPETGEFIARLLNKFGYNLFSVSDNIQLGVCFLALLLEYNETKTALQKYYAGRLWDTELARKYRDEVMSKLVSIKNRSLVE